jgi:hypothetical protein
MNAGFAHGAGEVVRARPTAARGILLAAAVAVLAAGLTLVALRGEAKATLPLNLSIRSTADPQQLGATTSALVELYNHGDHDIRPRFSVSWLPYPYYWRIVSGPPVLARGERATYEIAAPDTVAAPHDGDSFQIKVNDANGITYALSSPIQIAKRELPIVNPGLRMWTQRDPSTGRLSPAGWQTYQKRGDGDVALVESVSVFGVNATHLRVVQDGQPDPDGWAHAGLVQEIPFPETPFELRVLGRTPYKANDAGWPLAAFGLEVSDASNGLIWLLFQQTGNGDREYDLPSGHHIIVYDVPSYEWTSKTIDLPGLYHRLNWSAPKKVTLNLFAAAASAQAGDVEGYVSGIATSPSTPLQAAPSRQAPEPERISR